MAYTTEELLQAYRRVIRLPWDRSLAPAQRIWMAVYDPMQERRLRHRLQEFEIATREAGYAWRQLDLAGTFATWMAHHDYAEAYFEEPEFLDSALDDYTETVATQVAAELGQAGMENGVLGLYGLASLFGLTRASKILEEAAPAISGRMLVFFPGEHEGSNYRLLDARDGWNYLAVPLTPAIGA